MSELRGLAAVAVFCGGVAAIWFLWGRIGLAGAGAMMFVMWTAIGLITGWWMGRDGQHDELVAELSKRFRTWRGH